VELEEVLHRVVRRYGAALALVVLLAVLVAGVVVSRQPKDFVSTARVQLTATTPETATAADAIVSQARAAVTSQSAVQQALTAAGVRRDLATVIRDDVLVGGRPSISRSPTGTRSLRPRSPCPWPATSWPRRTSSDSGTCPTS
jgi:hypothetical protein